MIKYLGIKKKGNVDFILFGNENNEVVEIPISKEDAFIIPLYLNKISTAKVELNIEESLD